MHLGPECRALRLRLRALEWVVLEDVALDAVLDPAGRALAATSARRIAANLALDPGTVARALTHLRAQGLIEHSRSQGADGRFGLSAYLLAPIPGIYLVEPSAPEPVRPRTERPGVEKPPTASPSKPTPKSRNAAATQLDLLGTDTS
ncbi:MAG: MarR family transcriptional regulator [Actinobacteria bacterium]|nr:MarR family transcriptional regulator [Actinomycetota bacterium]